MYNPSNFEKHRTGAIVSLGKSPHGASPPHQRGYTFKELDVRRRQQAATIASLTTSQRGRSVLRAAAPDIDRTATAITDIIDEMSLRMEQSSTAPSRTAAAIALSDIQYLIDRRLGRPHYLVRTRLFSKCQGLHATLDRFVRSRTTFQARDDLNYTANKTWGWIGAMMTGVAASLIIFSSGSKELPWGYLVIAAAIIALRFVMTAVVWWRNAYPGDDTPDNAVLDTHPGMCVLGHFADMALFTSFGVYLERGTGWVAGIVILVLTNLLMLATLIRLAARTPRLHLERMARGATSFVAIIGFLSSQPVVILGAFFPAGLIAAVETLEAFATLRHVEPESGQTHPSRTVPRQALTDISNNSYETPLLIVDV